MASARIFRRVCWARANLAPVWLMRTYGPCRYVMIQTDTLKKRVSQDCIPIWLNCRKCLQVPKFSQSKLELKMSCSLAKELVQVLNCSLIFTPLRSVSVKAFVGQFTDFRNLHP